MLNNYIKNCTFEDNIAGIYCTANYPVEEVTVVVISGGKPPKSNSVLQKLCIMSNHHFPVIEKRLLSPFFRYHVLHPNIYKYKETEVRKTGIALSASRRTGGIHRDTNLIQVR